MALESVNAAETLIQSNDDNDLEDGEIPSDEDDEVVVPPPKPPVEPPKPDTKQEPAKPKSFDNKFNKNSKKSPVHNSSKHDRFLKYKNPTEDWAGDVEKAIKAALEEDGPRSQDSKSKNKNNRNKSRKRGRDDKEDDRSKDQKKRRLSDDENANDDEDEMLFVRGASPVRKDAQENTSPRHNNEHESFDSNSDYEERPSVNRHRENDNKRNTGRGGGRRGGKNERGGKNKGRGQMRNDRNGRRVQSNDQDNESICVYYMQGKCHRGDDCPFSHNALPPRKMELCKFYLMDCCAKRDKCLYMHHDFPCKFFHTGLKCHQGENCKFSHQPLSEQVKGILLKHLETAPKEILGDFPRLSRENAVLRINNTAKMLAQGQDAANQKIPSLFELNVPAPAGSTDKNEDKEDRGGCNDESGMTQQKSNTRERKQSGKKTRWGSDEDRVPYEQIMLLQSANELGLQLPNAALGLAAQQQQAQPKQPLQPPAVTPMEFYTETKVEPKPFAGKTSNKEDFTKDVEEDEILAQAKKKGNNVKAKDIDLRQLLKTKKPPPVVSIADEVANLTKSSLDEGSDQDEENDLVIEMPVDEEDKERQPPQKEETRSTSDRSSVSQDTAATDTEVPSHLPEKTRELFMRIQQQQRAAQDSLKNIGDEPVERNPDQVVEDWYSDDEDDDDNDDDDEGGGNLMIVLSKDGVKDESEPSEKAPSSAAKDDVQPSAPTSNVPQPAAIVDKLGDLSKIDISAEVSKLLSSLKAQSGKLSVVPGAEEAAPKTTQDASKTGVSGLAASFPSTAKVENETSSPRSSPVVSRDPRMSRDPRQRRDELKTSTSPSRAEPKRESKPLRLETSIYSSGITPMDVNMDTDLRARADQDLRRKDMDFRQRFQTGFGDTDLRMVGTSFAADAATKSDVDLRQMLSLPFKPAPSHVPCTEIDASVSSHPPMSYKVYVVDIPRPDYTGLKLTKNDPQVKYDPRLRKIFQISKTELADSPMSPPPVKMDSPKSPPQVRADPRRKALEAATNQATHAMSAAHMHGQPTQPQQQQQQPPMDMQNMGLGPAGHQSMPGPASNMPGPGMGGPSGPMMPGMGGPNPMMGNMGPPMVPMMNAPMGPNMPPMGMPPGMPNVQPNMGMNGPRMPQNQMNFDPRYNPQRNNGAGLLGPAPVVGVGFPPDVVGPNFDGPPYPGGNFGNFGPGGGPGPGHGHGHAQGPPEPGMMGFGSGPGPNAPNFSGMDGPEWNPNNPNRRGGGGGRARRRNRARANVVANN